MISPKNSSFKISVGIRNVTDFSPFGVELKGRNFEVVGGGNYRYSFQGQETDSEVKGEGNSVNYKYRMHDPRLGRFFAVDPLAGKYPHNSPYAFSENRVIDGVELEGLEVFIIHGTSEQTYGDNFSEGAKEQFKRITGNTKLDDSFRWNSPFYNTPFMRKASAKELVKHIREVRGEMIKNGEITKDEPISLVGFSHGGNVGIQAAKMLGKKGVKVNLITVSTPAYNSWFDCDNDNSVFGDEEDPQGNDGINEHLHFIHENDEVAGTWVTDSDPTYSNKKTTNRTIKNEDIKLDGGIEAHKDLPGHKSFESYLKKIPKMDPAPAPPKF